MFRDIFGVVIFLAAIKLPFCEYIVQNCIFFRFINSKPKQLKNVDNCSLLQDLEKRYF